jgi:predicted Zn-dependent protease
VWINDTAGHSEFVSGSIALNTAQRHLYGDGTDARPTWMRLLEHELGHIVGLDHVSDPRSLMYPQVQPTSVLTRGDRIGLRRVGGQCADAGRP